MRTSGRGGSETLLFLAPAAIFGGFFLWLYGGPVEMLTSFDRSLLGAGRAALAWLAALFS